MCILAARGWVPGIAFVGLLRGQELGDAFHVRFEKFQRRWVKRKQVNSMRDLGQQGVKHALRLPGLQHGPTVLAMLWLCLAMPSAHSQTERVVLPDAPSALLSGSETAAQEVQQPQTSQTPSPGVVPPQTNTPAPTGPVSPCPKSKGKTGSSIVSAPFRPPACADQLQLIVVTGYIQPLTSKQKGLLALHSVTDPFNLLTIAAFSGITVAADSHTVYGPGFAGWGRSAGYSLAEDMQGAFTGIYVLPSLFHEDPRYHRMPKASVKRRIAHALIHTFVSQHDDGSVMPNYATLINVPLSAEISNLYVPDIGTNVPDTAKRILVGYATDPIGPLVAEFLPDFARHVHIRILFTQQLMNRIAVGSGTPSP
jgi:hypothetical protein